MIVGKKYRLKKKSGKQDPTVFHCEFISPVTGAAYCWTSFDNGPKVSTYIQSSGFTHYEEIPEKREVWINFYEDGYGERFQVTVGGVWETEEEATKRSKDAKNLFARKKFIVTKGEGL